MLFNTKVRVKSYQFLHIQSLFLGCNSIYLLFFIILIITQGQILLKIKKTGLSNFYFKFLILLEIRLQVLHGCRQSVLWKVRLTPLTDEIPFVNLYLTIDDY
uniref:Transmembrane protein n=1 Tax=Cyclocybe aegerita TaxID=1973307 RepID=A0A884P6J8_CYCAE|nr:hypothetical protein K4014_mgp19 [Cyclocybe aegerita]QQP21457.1 hypothetical protein [Cyclocybe aegerita]